MFIIYDLIFLVIVIFSFPVYLFRGKFHRDFPLRFGILPKGLDLGRPIWLHAVSVGEAKAVAGLLAELRKAYPKARFVISTVTATGNKIAKSIAKEGDFVTYLPLDFGFCVRKAIDKINPSLFLLAETEIWPNLINYLYKKNIPVLTVNGRISDRSFGGYRMVKFMIKPILNKVTLFCLQSETDKERLISLGVREEKIRVTGNMKFDLKDADLKKDYADTKMKLGLKPEDKLMVCGSTHPGEEELILGAYKKILGEFGNLKLLIAPRHPERRKDVEAAVSSFGFRSVYLSGGSPRCSTCLTNPVFILDTVGELNSFYAIADIVFVGGSLVRKGGHNILEPAQLGRPVLFGPYTFNFRDITDLFLSNNAAIMVNGVEELGDNIASLLKDPSRSQAMAERAKKLILQNQGATGKNLENIKGLYQGEY